MLLLWSTCFEDKINPPEISCRALDGGGGVFFYLVVVIVLLQAERLKRLCDEELRYAMCVVALIPFRYPLSTF